MTRHLAKSLAVEDIERDVEVAISTLLCRQQHARYAACGNCQAAAGVLARVWAQTIMAASSENVALALTHEKNAGYYPKTKTLTEDEAVAAGRAVGALTYLANHVEVAR